MNKESLILLFNNLLAISLAFTSVFAMTVGIPYELIILGFVVGLGLFLFLLYRQKTWKWRLGFVVVMAIALVQIIDLNIELDLNGTFISTEMIHNLSWIDPIFITLGPINFWLTLIDTLRVK